MFCVSAAHWDFTEVSGKGVVVIDRYMRKRNAVDMLLSSIGYYVPAFGLKICCCKTLQYSCTVSRKSLGTSRIAGMSLGRVWGRARLL